MHCCQCCARNVQSFILTPSTWHCHIVYPPTTLTFTSSRRRCARSFLGEKLLQEFSDVHSRLGFGFLCQWKTIQVENYNRWWSTCGLWKRLRYKQMMSDSKSVLLLFLTDVCSSWWFSVWRLGVEQSCLRPPYDSTQLSVKTLDSHTVKLWDAQDFSALIWHICVWHILQLKMQRVRQWVNMQQLKMQRKYELTTKHDQPQL